jgi:hypothetical protein
MASWRWGSSVWTFGLPKFTPLALARTRRLAVSCGDRACSVERAGHFLLDALHCAGANAQLAGNLQDAHALAQMTLDSFFNGRTHPRASRTPAGPFPLRL